MGKDILAINDNFSPYILIGNLVNDNHSFDLSYIIYLNYQYYLTKEIEFIQKYGIEYYISEKTVLDEKNNKELISPIFDGQNEIGYFYKYADGINYDEIL